jgi:hypothetical protein
MGEVYASRSGSAKRCCSSQSSESNSASARSTEAQARAEIAAQLRAWGWRDGRWNLGFLLQPENLARTFNALARVRQAESAGTVLNPCGYFVKAWIGRWMPVPELRQVERRQEAARDAAKARERAAQIAADRQTCADNQERAAVVRAIESRMPAAVLAQIEDEARREVPWPPEDWLYDASYRIKREELILARKAESFTEPAGRPGLAGAPGGGQPGRTSPAPLSPSLGVERVGDVLRRIAPET